MPTPTFRELQLNPNASPAQQVAAIEDYVVKLIRDLNYLMGHLDTVNINRLDAKVIIASTITALQIAASTITADKLSVSELSAIAADLGTITAGIIYGAYIATANGTYPRIELSSVGNLLQALYSATVYISIDPGDGSTTDPNIQFKHPNINSAIGHSHSTGDQFVILSTEQIDIDSATSIQVKSSAGTISDLVSTLLGFTSSISTLTTDLAGKANTGGSTSSVSISDSHNHGIASTDYIQLYDAAGNPTTLTQWAPWGGAPAHSHTI